MATPILDHAQSQNFGSTFHFYEFVSTYKKEGVSLICFGDTVDLKILQSDYLRAFWPNSQEQGFFPNIGLMQQHKKYKCSLSNKFNEN